MTYGIKTSHIISGILGIFVFVTGLLFLFLVHPVPGIVCLGISLLYLPQANSIFKKWFGFSIPPAVKIIIAIAIIWFTLGISDLGDMID